MDNNIRPIPPMPWGEVVPSSITATEEVERMRNMLDEGATVAPVTPAVPQNRMHKYYTPIPDGMTVDFKTGVICRPKVSNLWGVNAYGSDIVIVNSYGGDITWRFVDPGQERANYYTGYLRDAPELLTPIAFMGLGDLDHCFESIVGKTFIHTRSTCSLPNSGLRINTGDMYHVIGRYNEDTVRVIRNKETTSRAIRMYHILDMRELTAEEMDNYSKGRPLDYKFDPMEYLAKIITITGKGTDSMPSDLLASIKKCTDETAVNKLYFPWVEQFKVDGMTPGDEEFFKEILTVDNSEQIDSLKRAASAHQGQANIYLRMAQEQLEAMAKVNADIRGLLVSGGHSLVEDIKKLLADGWYTLSQEETARLQRFKDTTDIVAFLTPPITLRDVNHDAGVDQSCDMGRYIVAYRPKQAHIAVYKYKDNVVYGGYYHPHVGESGSICWGNAAEVATSSLKNNQPSRALTALRTLLQTYNDDSPYASLHNFIDAFELGEDPTVEDSDEEYYEEEEYYDEDEE